MKLPDCLHFSLFTPGSWCVHVAVLSLICADGGPAGERDETCYQVEVD